MNTLHLKYAVEVERTQSITQAADNLYMAQPNLSKAIKELEDTLGITIFERTSKGVVPTAIGAEFLEYAKNILAQIEKMELLYNPQNPDRQYFSISIPRGSYIASAFTRFAGELDREKEIDVAINETNSLQAIVNVTEGRFNLGIIRFQTMYENYFLDYLAEKGLCFEPIWEFEYLVVMSGQHPLAAAKKIRFSELGKFIEIVHGDTIIPYLPAGKARKTSETAPVKKRIYVYERCSQFDMLSHIPTTYMWVSPIPQEWLERYHLVQRSCRADNHRCKDLLIYPKGYRLSELDKKFIARLYESKNEVAFQEYD